MRNTQLPTIIATIFSFLNENVEYAVLRNYDGLPTKNKSRDIDILIDRNSFSKIKKDLVKLIEKSNFKIITYFNSDRICTFVCGQYNSEPSIFQLDFFFHTSAFGTILLPSECALKDRVYNGWIYHVTEEYMFLDKYLYLKYIGSAFPEKYSWLKSKMYNNVELNRILQELFKIESLDILEAMPTSKFRHLVLRRNAQMFFKADMINHCRFYILYIKNYIFGKGYSIGFTGPDGVGKTTVINEIEAFLRTVYSNTQLYHFRPSMFGNLSDVAHSAGIKKTVDRNYSKPHRGNKTSKFSSFLRLLYYSIDYILGYYSQIRLIIRKRGIIIFDRYYTDIICDSRRTRIYLNHKFLHHFGRFFSPSLNYNILLTADSNTILTRKHELDREGIESINRKIDYLAAQKGYYKVLNNGTPQEAVTKILHIVFDQQHRKNLKRLKK